MKSALLIEGLFSYNLGFVRNVYKNVWSIMKNIFDGFIIGIMIGLPVGAIILLWMAEQM